MDGDKDHKKHMEGFGTIYSWRLVAHGDGLEEEHPNTSRIDGSVACKHRNIPVDPGNGADGTHRLCPILCPISMPIGNSR